MLENNSTHLFACLGESPSELVVRRTRARRRVLEVLALGDDAYGKWGSESRCGTQRGGVTL
jgi:hypothetical protein